VKVDYRSIIRTHSQSLEVIPTGRTPVLHHLPGIRAVFFDIYGTLFISGSGEIGSTQLQGQAASMVAALNAVGLNYQGDGVDASEILQEAIAQSHRRGNVEGIEYPEVSIVAIWIETLTRLRRAGLVSEAADYADPERLAIEYEIRVNPVWPMPTVLECLEKLGKEKVQLGIISNAQFFTRELFPALLERDLEDFGITPMFEFYSFRYGRAKPGTYLYEQARSALSGVDIKPEETLYVGNDMLNDIAPATKLGFRTALFAGDSRSLRLREGDERVAGVAPDLVVTELKDIPDHVLPKQP